MSGSQETRTLQALVRERIDRWRGGSEPNATVVLEEYPELRGAKSLVLDLALAEYSLRTAQGGRVKRDEFCDRFPTFRQSIARMLDVQDYLDKCPGSVAADGAGEEEQARWPQLGQEFLGYELVEPLGRGGLARVYLARETKVGGRWVVVKISRQGGQEAAALGKLSHPSVAPIHSVQHDAAGEWTLICMPLLGVATGVDLLDAAFEAGAKKSGVLVERVAVETKPLTPIQGSGVRTQQSGFDWDLTYGEAIARVGLQLAEGLMAAHAAGIMHRDIKPSNILLAWSGRAMLLDFNLSMDASAEDAVFGGTLAYMAPEMMECMTQGDREAARRFDPRCDVYSLGAVLFELLAGRLPAEPKNAEKLSPAAYQPWLNCKQAKIAAPTDADVDPRLMAIVLKCLEVNAGARYSTAAELAGELRAFLARAARPRAVRKLRRQVLAAAAVALLVVGGGAWAYVGSRPMTIEQLYQRGLAEYSHGNYAEAVSTFTQCLERRSGWTEALFGRGQALLKLEKWTDARADFMALKEVDAAWANAFAGYCSLQAKDNGAALGSFWSAHQAGLRHTAFLMDYARVEMARQRSVEASQRYSEVIALEPTNMEAIRSRAIALFMVVVNDRSRIPSEQAFKDVEAYVCLAPGSFEPYLCGAIVYGEAARKDSTYEAKAISYLTEALLKGMPLDVADLHKQQIKRLVPFVDGQLLVQARRDSSYRFRTGLAQELPDLADWAAFSAQFRTRHSLLVKNQ